MEKSAAQLPDFDEHGRPTWLGPRRGLPQPAWGAGVELIRIHDHLRSEAEGLLAAIDNHIAGRNTIAPARSILLELSQHRSYSAVGSLCSGFCTLLSLHHSIEDRSVFPRLGRLEPELHPVLAKLMEEHEVIAEIIDFINAAIDATEADRAKAPELRRIALHLKERLASHLAYEESQIVSALNVYA